MSTYRANESLITHSSASARSLHFAAGFFGVQTFQQDYHQLIIPESAGMNNTLAAGEVCPNANNDIAAFGVLQSLKWANIYLQPTLKRLQKSIDGLELDVFDLVAMQMACAYEVDVPIFPLVLLLTGALDRRVGILCLLQRLHRRGLEKLCVSERYVHVSPIVFLCSHVND